MDLSSRHLILGSASPRRRQLLEGLGWKVDVIVKETPEIPPPQLKKGDVATHLAELKANAFNSVLTDTDLLITADTIVCLDDRILNKPENEKHAFEMIKSLAGRDHQVFTGVCISNPSKRDCFSVETIVHFNHLSDSEILEYIAHYKPFDKAGAYGAQECLPESMNPCSPEELEFINSIGQPDYFRRTLAMDGKKHIPIIQRIDGSYFNVMGLPVVEVWSHLQEFLKS